MVSRPPFHLAIPVRDLAEARRFYVDVLGCGVGRESGEWIDFDFRGHQVTAHLVDAAESAGATNPVDGHDVPVRHFGLVLEHGEWEALAARLRASAMRFLIEPTLRFEGRVGEQATMFLSDPSGNAIELKSFRDPMRLFARE